PRRNPTAGTPPLTSRDQVGQGRERQAHDSDDELGAGTVHHEDDLGGPCGQRGTQQPQVERRRRRPRGAHQSVTCPRSFSSVASPMPLTSSSSSGWVKRPWSVRHRTMAAAVTGPTPGSCSSAAWSAVLRLTCSSAPPATEEEPPIGPATPPAAPSATSGTSSPGRGTQSRSEEH